MASKIQIEFSVDLLSAAEREATFLRYIEKNHFDLYDMKLVENAVRRYETIWLPLQARRQDTSLAAPIDVHWIWHTHMLSPLNYRKDCKQITDTIVNHSYLHPININESHQRSLRAWEEFSGGEPYDYRLSQPVSYQQKSTYNIKEAVQRQRHFNYHVSLPHYTSRTFLTESVERYKRYLSLIRSYPGEFFTPCYDFDLVWHAHQAHPWEYAKDTKRLLGRILDHNDTVDDRPHGKQLIEDDGRTRNRWQENYPDDPFWRRGSMYRGHKAPMALGIESESIFASSEAQICFDRIVAQGLSQFATMNMNMRLDGKLLANFSMRKEADTFQWFSGRENTKFPIALQKNQMLVLKPKFNGNRHSQQIAQIPFRNLAHEFIGMETIVGLNDRKSKQPTGAVIRLQSRILPIRRHLYFTRGNFVKHQLRDGPLFELCYAAALNKPGSGESMEIFEAIHTLSQRIRGVSKCQKESVYSIKVIQSAQHLLSLICVHDPLGRLLAMSHLAGPDTLPSNEQIGLPPTALNEVPTDQSDAEPHLSSLDERAMVVMNEKGDHCLVKGKWVGFQRRTAAVRGRGGRQGYPGYLALSVYSLYSSTTKVIRSRLPSSYTSDWKLNIGATEGRQNGEIWTESKTAPEDIATVFSAMNLFILCNPDKIRISDNRRFSTIGYQCNRWGLARGCGYGTTVATPSNRYLVEEVHRRRQFYPSGPWPYPYYYYNRSADWFLYGAMIGMVAGCGVYFIGGGIDAGNVGACCACHGGCGGGCGAGCGGGGCGGAGCGGGGGCGGDGGGGGCGGGDGGGGCGGGGCGGGGCGGGGCGGGGCGGGCGGG